MMLRYCLAGSVTFAILLADPSASAAAAAAQATPSLESITLSWGPLSRGWSVTLEVKGPPPSSRTLGGSGQMVLVANPAAYLAFQKGVRLEGKEGPLLARVALVQRKGLATPEDLRASEYVSKDPELAYDIGEVRVMGRRAFSIVSKQVELLTLKYLVEIDPARGLWLLCGFGVFVEGGQARNFPGEIAELMNALRVGSALRVAVGTRPSIHSRFQSASKTAAREAVWPRHSPPTRTSGCWRICSIVTSMC